MDTAVGNGLFVFVLGLLVVFLGMIIIILAVSLFGKIFSIDFSKFKKAKKSKKEEVAEILPNKETDNEVPEHVKAAIVAAISAYYFNQKSKPCDFVVKSIKRY